MSWNDITPDAASDWNGNGGASEDWGSDKTGSGGEHSSSGPTANTTYEGSDPSGGPQFACFNCGEVGHAKKDCTNPKVERPFSGTCRICAAEGHRAVDCPQKKPTICKNCGKEGHLTSTCTEHRALDLSKYPDMPAEEAWVLVEKACEDRDLHDLKEAIMTYAKAHPDTTFAELEEAFRSSDNGVHIIALEQDVPDTMTLVNLQGKIDCKHTVTYAFSARPKRTKVNEGWPETSEVNVERLKDAGVRQDRRVPKCSNCQEMGHIGKHCKADRVEHERIEIKCVNCQETGHRMRDCKTPRPEKFKCRNCMESGHAARDCPNPKSAEGIECKKCHEIGHFARDCNAVSE